MSWVEENHKCTKRKKDSELGEGETSYYDDTNGDALWNENGSTNEETERKMKGMEMRLLQFAQGKTRKDKIKNKLVGKRMEVGSLQDKLREWRLR